jgi:hypothetical protein
MSFGLKGLNNFIINNTTCQIRFINFVFIACRTQVSLLTFFTYASTFNVASLFQM